MTQLDIELDKMKNILLTLLLLSPLAFAEDKPLIVKSCASDSGQSIYDIEIKDDRNFYGEIRYRFAEQDVFYTANTKISDGNLLIGIAEFKSSRTGEKKGISWIYTYNIKENILLDNDNVIAFCG